MKISTAFLVLPLAALQGCVATREALTRSTTEVALPLGPVHVPATRDGISTQVGVSLHATLPNQYKADLEPSTMGNFLESTDELDPGQNNRIEVEPFQGAVNGSLFLSRHLRATVGVEGSSRGLSPWTELGVSWGEDISVETFVATGYTPVTSRGVWEVVNYDSTWNEEFTVTPPARWTQRPFVRAGFHLGQREEGWYGELQWLHLALMESPEQSIELKNVSSMIGAGWNLRMSSGVLTLGARGVWSGKALIPSTVVQWTL